MRSYNLLILPLSRHISTALFPRRPLLLRLDTIGHTPFHEPFCKLTVLADFFSLRHGNLAESQTCFHPDPPRLCLPNNLTNFVVNLLIYDYHHLSIFSAFTI